MKSYLMIEKIWLQQLYMVIMGKARVFAGN